MDTSAFLAVIFAASLHAGWNALMKVNLDRAALILLLAASQGLIALVLVPFFPFAPAGALPLVVLSGLLHTGYNLFLIRAYAHGDLSQAYPVARGAAPMIVALVSMAVLAVPLDATGLAAVSCISAGVLWIGLARRDGLAMSRKALGFALGTACFTASYTLVDGIGVRLSGTASGFILSTFVVQGILMSAVFGLTRGRAAFLQLRPALAKGAAAGAMSLTSYWIAAWAFTRAPVALVAALRETSILFALAIAALALGERIPASRWCAAGLILCGMVLMRL